MNYHHKLPLSAARIRDGRIEKFARLVPWTATRFFSRVRGEVRVDLVAAGNIGLVNAADQFNPSLGFTFATYAVPAIRREMLRHLAKERKSTRYGVEVDGEFEMRAIISLDAAPAASRADSDVKLLDTIADPDTNVEADAIARADSVEAERFWQENVRPVVGDRNYRVLRMIYKDEIDAKTIAAAVGVSHQRVSQINAWSLGRLRKRFEKTGVSIGLFGAE